MLHRTATLLVAWRIITPTTTRELFKRRQGGRRHWGYHLHKRECCWDIYRPHCGLEKNNMDKIEGLISSTWTLHNFNRVYLGDLAIPKRSRCTLRIGRLLDFAEVSLFFNPTFRIGSVLLFLNLFSWAVPSFWTIWDGVGLFYHLGKQIFKLK